MCQKWQVQWTPWTRSNEGPVLVVMSVTSKYVASCIQNKAKFRNTESILPMKREHNQTNNMLMSKTTIIRTLSTVAWWRLWNFIVRQVKFNTISHHNESPQRIFCLEWIFCYILTQFEAEPSKIGHNFTKEVFWIWTKLKMILVNMFS